MTACPDVPLYSKAQASALRRNVSSTARPFTSTLAFIEAQQLQLETTRFPGSKRHSDRQPAKPRNQRGRSQTYPHVQADQEPQRGHDQVAPGSVLAANPIAKQGSEVHAHEPYEGS